MSVVQLFGREREEARRFGEVNDAHRKAQVKTVFYFALFWPAVETIASIALGLVLWFGGLMSASGVLTLGTLIAFVQYVRQFFEPIRNLSDQYNTLQGAMAGAERIFEVLDHDEALPVPAEPFVPERMQGSIAFEDVWFAYDGAEAERAGREPHWILRGVSFTVNAGTSTAIVGATGAGKTTIITLLLRFYDVQRGRVLVDGVDVRDYALAALRRHIGLVLQDVFLFSGSVEANVTLGEASVTPERVRQAAAEIGADRFIERLPLAYAQDVKERGATLSHGQRQMLSFVRALVYDPAVLVLDEATSSVDTETEEAIQTRPRAPHGRPHERRHRPPPLDHPARPPDPRDAPGRGARAGLPRRTARPRRPLPPPLRTPVPRPGSPGRRRGHAAVARSSVELIRLSARRGKGAPET